MRILALLLLALPVFAAPAIDRIEPPFGFRFGATQVMIYGTDFTAGPTIFCQGLTCPVQVYFGEHRALVHEVTPRFIRLTIIPSPVVPAGTVVDVRVVIEGRGEVVRARGFTFEDESEGGGNYVQYLVPVTGETISGANGSRWTGELTFFNGSDYNAVVIGPFASPFILTPPMPNAVTVAPDKTAKPMIYGSGSSAGAFVYVPNPLDEDVRKSLRVRDLSRNAGSWGTKIPIVSRAEIESVVTLIDIPTDPQYRATLRIYHWSDFGNLPAEVRIYADGGAEPVARFDVASSAAPGHQPGANMPFYPSYSQVDLLTPAVRAAGSTIRVEVDNLQESYRYSPPLPGIWAFVSVTNNETQQVTVMTPK